MPTLTLNRQNTSEHGIVIQTFESDGVRVTASHQPPADIVGFILSFDFEGSFYHCLEWSLANGFDYGKMLRRSPDIVQTSEPDRPFASDRVPLVVAPEHQLLFTAIQNKIDEYEDQLN